MKLAEHRVRKQALSRIVCMRYNTVMRYGQYIGMLAKENSILNGLSVQALCQENTY